MTRLGHRLGRVICILGLTSALLLMPAAGLAAAPGSAAPVTLATMPPEIGSGDSRSDGGGPGIVGSPVAIALGVVVLGVLTVVGTLLIVRVSGMRGQ